ncbi:MAG: Nif3-like dinuclear metal center hexameric protein [Geobacteraceae bacterium]|nr:Nif3-like dinuclear metal center hexameric protein [Geobacteraceae bacterium]
MNPRVSDIIEIIDGIAPFRSAEEWDNVGLQVGDPTVTAARIMISLDPCRQAVEEAVASGCQLLITHHPLIFKPIRTLNLQEQPGEILAKALRNNLNIISMHTNYDAADGGINDLLAKRIGLCQAKPLTVQGTGELVKLAVFVPKGHEEKVMETLFRFCGHIGNYIDCSFQTDGTGTFKPLPGADPYMGTIGQREYADETRIEVLLRAEDVPAACKALIEAHPYEEPAYDLYPLLNKGTRRGLGRIGRLSCPVTLEQLASRLKDDMGLAVARYVGDGNRLMEKVALCGGSGASLLRQAHSQGAQVLVTGDVKYHDAREAEILGMCLIDIGHFASEIPMVNGFCAVLREEVGRKGFEAEIIACGNERDPFVYC